MSTVRKIHSQDLIAVLNRSEIHRHVSLRATMRLNVGVIGAKQLLRAVDGCLLDYIGPFTPAVIPLAGITFGVFVCENGAGSFQNCFTDEVFRSDEFESIRLPCNFVVNGIGNYWIYFGEWGVMRVGHWCMGSFR